MHASTYVARATRFKLPPQPILLLEDETAGFHEKRPSPVRCIGKRHFAGHSDFVWVAVVGRLARDGTIRVVLNDSPRGSISWML